MPSINLLTFQAELSLDHIAVIFAQLVMHVFGSMTQKVAVLVHGAALNGKVIAPKRRQSRLSLLLIPSGTEILVFWVLQRLAWLVAPKDVPLMTRRGDLKLSHGATAKAERTP